MSTKNLKKCKEIIMANNCNFINFCKSKFAQASLFLTFCHLLSFLQLKIFFSSNIATLDLDLEPDPDPHSEKLLDPDPDPHKMNAAPQP